MLSRSIDQVIRVISAIFLRETLEAANNDAEILVQERLRKKATYVRKLESVLDLLVQELLIDLDALLTRFHLFWLRYLPSLRRKWRWSSD